MDSPALVDEDGPSAAFLGPAVALRTGKSSLNESNERTYHDVMGTPSIVELTSHAFIL